MKPIRIALLLSFVALLCPNFLQAGTDYKDGRYKQVDACSLTLWGKIMETPNPYERVDFEKYSGFDEGIAFQLRKAAGIAVAFRTDSRNIVVSWKMRQGSLGDNSSALLQRGMDLYIKHDGEWLFAGVGRPSVRDTVNVRSVIEDMDEGVKECLLYLPINCNLEEVFVGVDRESMIEPLANPFRHRIIVVGSSITHGYSAARAGLAYPARMSRLTGMDFINLGTSGNCRMQPELADMLRDVEADAFVFDAFSNPTAEEIDNWIDYFVRTIRESHPGVPMIFIQDLVKNEYQFSASRRKTSEIRRETASDNLERLMKEVDDLYFLDIKDIYGTDKEATADTTHPNDLGFDRLIDNVLPPILRILEKYGIK